jgi:zinc protease
MQIVKWLLISLCMLVSVTGFSRSVLEVQHFKTSKGVNVLFFETHELPILDVQIIFNAGSAYDDHFFGISQFTNAMLNEGTKKLNADQIADEFDRVGAEFSSTVDRDMAVVGLRSLTDQALLNSALETFTQVLSEPRFATQDFQRVQKQILSAIKQKHQYPGSIAGDTFYKLLYEDQPYAHPVLGTKEMIESLKPQDLRNFYQKYYVANNAMVAMVGDVSLEQAKRIVDRVLSELPVGGVVDQLPVVSSNVTEKIEEHITFPSEQTHILMGQTGITWHTPDFFPLLVGNYILGRAPLTSELFKEVRNKRGLAYSVGSCFVLLKYGGPFVVDLQTRTDQSLQAVQIVRQTLERFVREGPTNERLLEAKQSLKGQFPLKFMDNQKILACLAQIGFYQLPLDYLDTYLEKIDAVTLEQVKKALGKYIHPNKMITVTVGLRRQKTEDGKQ